MKSKSFLAAALVLSGTLLAAPLDASASANKSLRVGDGEQVGTQSTVNGSINIGNAAIVDGDVGTVNGAIRIGDDVQFQAAKTVNGSIRVGRGAITGSLKSVNGKIQVGESASISGGVEVVNGSIVLAQGTTVGDDIESVNGKLQLDGTDVSGSLSTVNGNVSLDNGSIVRGDVVIRKPKNWGFNWGGKNKKPRVVIGPNSQVLGSIVARQEIELYISDSASVGGVTGEASLDDAIRFSGDRP